MKTVLIPFITVALMALSAAASADEFETAMRHYEKGQYAIAIPLLHAAAKAGDARAQEFLGFMYAMGGTLYPGVAADREAALHWFDVAARNGRPMSRNMHCALREPPRSPAAGLPLKCFDWLAQAGQPAPR